MTYTREQIAAALDLAVLQPTARPFDIQTAAQCVEQEGIASVCVAPVHVAYAKEYTSRVCAVISFPHGNSTPGQKRREAMTAINQGAIELDVVLNYGLFLAGYPSRVADELQAFVRMAHKHHVAVKAILETCYYKPTQIVDACKLCVECGVEWVKTSTGFGPNGASPEAVQIMLDAVRGQAQVKASGGINDYATASRYLDMGCTRIGSSKYRELLP